MSSDLHPHDPLLSRFFAELLLAKQQLTESDELHRHDNLRFLEPLSRALISSAVTLDGSHSTRDTTTSRLQCLLRSENFITLLPVLLERLNTPQERLNLPHRGLSRNLDRGELDTFYTPIDLATWIASLTTKNGCESLQLLDDVFALRVCDFSCGSGVLLREAAEWIVRAYETIHRSLSTEALLQLPTELRFFKKGLFKLQCLSANLYGIDISAKSLESARLVLLLWAVEDLRRCPADLPMVSQLLGLNLRLASGSHWEVHREHVSADQSLHAQCLAQAERRATFREQIFAGEQVTEEATASSEVVHMFPEAFGDSTNPGFDFIVGNPPYGELPIEFEAQSSRSLFRGIPKVNRSRNQYAKFASSLLYLLRDGGFGAIICPLGLAYSNADTKTLRREIQKQNRLWNFAFFDRSPDALFGDMVKTRNAVLFCGPSSSGSPEIRTTHLFRWTRSLRSRIWGQVHPIPLDPSVDIGELVPKIGSDLELRAWRVIRSKTSYLRGSLHSNGYRDDSVLYCYSTAYNWLPFFRSNPASFADDGRRASPSTRQYAFGTPEEADVFYACLVSSVSFWLWTVESDGFHLTDSFVQNLPYALDSFPAKAVEELASLGREHDGIIRKSPMVKTNAGKNILNFNRHGAGAKVQRIDSILISALGIREEFFDVLQTRVSELIFAGRKTTRVHPLQRAWLLPS
jgi:hypothetical protein